jgi:hypothetical protein
MKRIDGNYSLYIVRGSWELSSGRLASFSPNYTVAERSSSGSRLWRRVSIRGSLSAVGVWTFRDPSR